METIKVETCQSCPFANNDNEYGVDGCNLKDIELAGGGATAKRKST